MSHITTPATLDLAILGQPLTVDRIQAPANAPEWARWLEEIGFIPGEQVTLMAKGIPGGDPLVVRIGQSTFALRSAEAACIRVAPGDPGHSVFVAKLKGNQA
ncbi:ferrous iron transport protein A [Formivibrio citricus]|uniref:Ferrous iron transport protein A n=1 Tax=Formivibrio citricus TaxID=83765 RepID=A0A1I4WKH2_9NEIS|nr:FeoA family protein [Formivibrio citricus]SFN13700.1 ferrous iron transport protein A [Formivibrio citricus]